MVSYKTFTKSLHIIDGLNTKPFKFDEWMRIVCTRYGNVEELKHNEPIHFRVCPELEEALEEIWSSVSKISFAEAMAVKDNDVARIYFMAVGPNEVLGAESTKKNLLNTYKHSDKLGDTYELYNIDPASIGMQKIARVLRALRYQCPSTGKTYWSFVPPESTSAKEAVAWMYVTQRKPEDILAIYRQGEVHFVYHKLGAVKLPERRHMTADEFWSKVKDQT